MAVVSLTLTSCLNVKVPDFWACTPITEDYGYCRMSLTNKETIVNNVDRKLNGKTWNQLREESVVLPEESYAALEAFILKICEKTKECSTDETQKVFMDLRNRGQNEFY